MDKCWNLCDNSVKRERERYEMCISDTITYIKILAQDLAGCDPSCAVLAILLDLAVPVHHDGFEYLKAAIVMQYKVPTRDLENDIYRTLAEQYNVSKETVSSLIRSVISAAWKRGDHPLWYQYLPTIDKGKSNAPTNAEVIAGLARALELWQGCADAYLRQQHKEVVSCGRE